MSEPVSSAIMAVGAVLGAFSSIQGNAQQAKAAKQARSNALRQEKAAEEATNRANSRRANTGAALDSALQAGRAGASGTLLTGPQGIDPNALTLGGNTLLGS